MLTASRDEGLIEDFAHELLTGVLDFGERDVTSVMVPRGEIRSITHAAPPCAEAESLVVESGHSRLLLAGRRTASTTCAASCTPRTCSPSSPSWPIGPCRCGWSAGCSSCPPTARSRTCCCPCAGPASTSPSVTDADGPHRRPRHARGPARGARRRHPRRVRLTPTSHMATSRVASAAMGDRDTTTSRDRLAAFLEGALGRDGLEVRDLARLSGGASRETWAFDLLDAVDGSTEPLILQRIRAGVRGGAPSMEAEAGLLRAAAAAGVPVAPVVAASDDAGHRRHAVPRDGSGRGRDDRPAPAPRRRVRRGPVPAGRPVRGGAGRHPRGAPVGDRAPRAAGADQPAPRPDRHARPAPSRVRARPALARAAPPARRSSPRVVHGDFRLGNLMVDEDGLAAVLDWELAHLGDPMEDLGWLCVRAWRFGSDLPVAGVGDYDELLAAYESASGTTVDPEVVRWWEVLGTLRWGVICVMQASSPPHRRQPLGRAGRHRPPGLRERVRPARPASAPDRRSTPIRRAVDDARSSSRASAQPPTCTASRRRRSWSRRCASSSRATSCRRPRVGCSSTPGSRPGCWPPSSASWPSTARDRVAHAARLASLGVADDAELAGPDPGRRRSTTGTPVAAVVWADVLAKLRVANPDYLRPERPTAPPTRTGELGRTTGSRASTRFGVAERLTGGLGVRRWWSGSRRRRG